MRQIEKVWSHGQRNKPRNEWLKLVCLLSNWMMCGSFINDSWFQPTALKSNCTLSSVHRLTRMAAWHWQNPSQNLMSFQNFPFGERSHTSVYFIVWFIADHIQHNHMNFALNNIRLHCLHLQHTSSLIQKDGKFWYFSCIHTPLIIISAAKILFCQRALQKHEQSQLLIAEENEHIGTGQKKSCCIISH